MRVMELEEKLDVLGSGASEDVACQSCAANPKANVITHRAMEPIAPETIQVRPRDLKPWLSHVIRSDGVRMPVVKTLMTSACEKDCFYCATRRGRNSLRRETFKPEELAGGFDLIHKKGIAEGLFLSSGVIGGGTRTMEKTIAAVEILRSKYEFRGYVHLKLMPGAQDAAIERALSLANRVSVNLEAPNTERLARLSSTKQFADELLAPLVRAHELIITNPQYAGKTMTTQFVVGAADESDREILSTVARLYRELELARAYYSRFSPIVDTPLENRVPTSPIRQHRLYQTDFLIRRYGFTFDELVFDAEGNLPTHRDPKLLWALHHPERFPLDINRVSREELVRVPGVGPQSAQRILHVRRFRHVTSIEELRRLGADAKRAAPFILLNGRRPVQQLTLFEV
jgi:predicted DNA-binding helix-hairpin-helix protein